MEKTIIQSRNDKKKKQKTTCRQGLSVKSLYVKLGLNPPLQSIAPLKLHSY